MNTKLRILTAGAMVAGALFIAPLIVGAQNALPNDSSNSGGVPTTLTPGGSGGSSWAWTFASSSSSAGGNNSATGGSRYCSGVGGSITGSSSTVSDVIKFFTCFLLNSVEPLIFAIALVTFLWGVVKFLGSGGSEEKAEGRKFMLWGVISLSVMLSVWGLTNILNQTFHVQNVIPQLPETQKTK